MITSNTLTSMTIITMVTSNGKTKVLEDKIRTEVVLANLGDAVDFEKLIASLKDKFGVAE